jgi:predicted ArsR family transcriptional regulator
VETFTTQDLINELLQLKPDIPYRREGGISVREWAATRGISKNTARDELDQWVKDGRLVAEYDITPDCRRPLKIYYKVT